jgi:hypothetical protein
VKHEQARVEHLVVGNEDDGGRRHRREWLEITHHDHIRVEVTNAALSREAEVPHMQLGEGRTMPRGGPSGDAWRRHGMQAHTLSNQRALPRCVALTRHQHMKLGKRLLVVTAQTVPEMM